MGDKDSNMGCLSLILAILILGGATFFVMNLGKDKPTQQETVSVRDQLLPEVASWLEKHSYHGTPKAVTEMPDWAMGKRQTVTMSGASGIVDYIFYLQNDSVATVYKINPAGERTEVWRK